MSIMQEGREREGNDEIVRWEAVSCKLFPSMKGIIKTSKMYTSFIRRSNLDARQGKDPWPPRRLLPPPLLPPAYASFHSTQSWTTRSKPKAGKYWERT